MRKKKKWLVCGLSAVLLLTGCTAKTGKLKFGAAALGGVYHTFATSFAEVASGDGTEDGMEVRTTAGSAANIRLLSENYIQLAVAQEDMANEAYNGTGSFEGNQYQGYATIARLYPEACQIVVRKDSDIENVEDLLGKTVSIGEEESGTEKNALQILQVNGISENMFTEVYLNYSQAAQELKDGKIDAFFCTAGVRTTAIEELAGQCEIRLLDVEESSAKKLNAAYGSYTEYEIPAGTYTGQDEAVHTVCVQAVLLASDSVSKDKAKELTQLLFDKKEELQYSVPASLQLDEQSATKNVTIPFHPGAAAYYKEKGIEVQTSK